MVFLFQEVNTTKRTQNTTKNEDQKTQMIKTTRS